MNESDAPAIDSTESESEDVAKTDAGEAEAAESRGGKKPPRRLRLTITLRSLVTAAVIAALVVAVAGLAWLYIDAQRKLDAQTRQSANNAHAEKIALDYAINAAEIKLTTSTRGKPNWLPVQPQHSRTSWARRRSKWSRYWSPPNGHSTARPLMAKVRSDSGGIYVVDCFVGVVTKTIQSPGPLQSTAAYSVTIDSDRNWEISDVGGIGAVVARK